MIASVVYATFPAAPRDDQVRMDATVVLLPPHEQQKGADPPPVQLADVLKGFQTVAVPAQIATDMPLVDSSSVSIPRITPVVALKAAGPAA